MRLVKFLITLVVLIPYSAFAISSKAKLTPQQTVMNFISDYEQWNEEAIQNLSEMLIFRQKMSAI